MFGFSRMQRNAAILSIGFLLLCLSCNYTFPLHRNLKKSARGSHRLIANHSQKCQRSETPLDQAEHTTTKYGHITLETKSPNKSFSEDDFRHYEQKVIMKKYPYLDFKEYELKYGPSLKLSRQNVKYEGGLAGQSAESSINERSEEGSYVEVTNRGLSGFAIPAVSKVIVMKGNKVESASKDIKEQSLGGPRDIGT